jgi:hypothetical protein
MSYSQLSVSDQNEILQLVNAYAFAMDRNDLDAFPDLFVAQGALIVREPGREKPMGVFRGPGIDGVGMIAQLMSELYRATLHHITSHESHNDGDVTRGTTYCLAYHLVAGEDGGAVETLGVRYDETFLRTPDGWRFVNREATRLWSQSTPTPREPLLIDLAAAAAHRVKHT